MDIEIRAKKLAGNWKKFESFCWTNEPEIDSQNWGIFYTHNRDSTLLDVSNAHTIDERLIEFIGDNLQKEDHNHWACGWIAGYSIKVYENGKITDVFRAYHEIQESLENYPVLDEDDYYTRESDATFENVKTATHDNGYDLTDEQIYNLISWYSDNEQSAIESKDDSGGWPTDEQIKTGCDALGYKIED